MKIIARLKAYKEDLRQKGDFIIIMSIYAWLFIFCILMSLILNSLLQSSEGQTFESWATLIMKIGFANFVVYVLSRVIIGKNDAEPKSFEERLEELQKEAKAREDFLEAYYKLHPKDKEKK